MVAQISIHAKARLYFEIERSADSWNEGFSRFVGGTAADYESHRSNGAQDKAFVVRSGNVGTYIEWKTGPVHLRKSNDSIRFIWVCGYGNNLAQEEFRLTINEHYNFQFSTTSEPCWSVRGTQGGRLGFTAVYQNHNRAHFGYMYVVLPKKGLNDRDSLLIRIESLPSKKETWFRTFGYADALKYLLQNEVEAIFTETNFINLGDATIRVYAPSEWTGKSVSLLSKGKELSRDVFRNDNDLATAQFDLPRKDQTENIDYLFVATDRARDTVWLKEIQEKRVKSFLEEELVFDKYVFPPGKFPSAHWSRPAMVANEIGNAQLDVSYFNRTAQPVKEATETGRYGAVVKIVLPSGFIVKRYVTLYCSRVPLDDYSSYVPITLSADPSLSISDQAWKTYQRNVRRFSFGSLMMFPAQNPDAAIFLSGLSEIGSVNVIDDTPRIRDRQWWISFRSGESGNLQTTNPLAKPKQPNGQSFHTLDPSTQPDDDYSARDLESIRMLCRSSAEKTHEPLVTLIAHKGKIVFHETFGKNAEGIPITRETPLWMASITKMLTGMLFMQFVDQGLVDLDAPVERYLPELATNDKIKITVRHLFTHTTGLSWVGEWGSDWEPSLENRIANGLPYAQIGERFEYHRIGYALAGKIMERITGIAVPYLFREYIFDPLHIQHAYADNTYGGLYCSAEELAIIAQALLQQGSYGSARLFSPETFKKMLPIDLSGINQKINRKWGIGTTILNGNGLSETAFGHEAASGSIVRIDPENELVIISGRNRIGDNYGEYERFVQELIERTTKPLRPSK